MPITPFNQIQDHLHHLLPEEMLSLLPRKWEKIGSVLVIKLAEPLSPYEQSIGEAYARFLHTESVLVDTGGITGPYREPMIRHIYGDTETETIHLENGVSFILDPQHIMFSSGNMDERIRMGTISHPEETIVDLFAGIGYFTIPMAVYSKPKTIYACEINPTAYQYLLKNVEQNKVSDHVSPLQGDSKDVAPKHVADRVIMGYFHDTRSFLPTALDCLRDHKGIIHYHDTFPDKKIPTVPLEMIQLYATRINRIAHLGYYHRVKSYAPGISHYVFDIEIRPEDR